jgi:hypothetical protein
MRYEQNSCKHWVFRLIYLPIAPSTAIIRSTV